MSEENDGRKQRNCTYVVYEYHSQQTREHESTLPIAPPVASHGHREQDGYRQRERDIVAVLPLHDGVVSQITDVRRTGLPPRLKKHPSHMRVKKTLVCVVWIEVRVCVPVMRAMTTSPPSD